MLYIPCDTLFYPNETLVTANIYSQMGTVAETLKGNPPQEYYKRAYMTMANIPHGSAIPPTYIAKLANDAIKNVWWDTGAPWVIAGSADSNTCTNARVLVAAMEVYVLRKSTGKWEKLVENDGKLNFGLDYYQISPLSFIGAADRKVAGKVNLPSFNDFSNVGTRGTNVSAATDYRMMHNAAHSKVALPGGGIDLAGIFVTCKASLISESGDLSFNGVCKKYASIGFDFWPTLSSSLAGDMAFSSGASYNPGSGQSQFVLLPTDGSWLRLYYIPYLGSGAFIDTTPAYYQANGAAAMTLTAAQIAANTPKLLPNTTIG